MSRRARPEGLSRRHRFRGRDSFRPLLRGPRKLTGQLAVLHVARSVEYSRFGIAVGRRAAASAVQRNLVKRRARELFRRHAARLGGVDIAVTLTTRFGPDKIDSLMLELGALLDRVRAVG